MNAADLTDATAILHAAGVDAQAARDLAPSVLAMAGRLAEDVTPTA